MGSVRRRRKSSASSDDTLQIKSTVEYVPRVVYAKRKKPDGRYMIGFQIFCVSLTLLALYYTYYHFDHFHFHLTHYYAKKWDDHHAQHALAHKLLKDRSNISAAFYWFRQSANNGHPESAYNLAAGHLSGYQTDVQKGEVKKLLIFAARNGVDEAKTLLRELCSEKPEYCEH